MDNTLLSTIRQDIQFLLSFLPAKSVAEVESGLAPMFYVTGTYEGDVKLMRRVEDICNRYETELDSDLSDQEDYVDAE